MNQMGSGDKWPPEVREKVRRDHAAREAVRGRYPDLFVAIRELMFRHDPIGINFGFNADEYDPEVGTVLSRLSSCVSVDNVEIVLKEEFSHWFGADIASRAKYAALADDIWRLWTECQ